MVDRAATGRTVLLSSHQISEVERVADRVAILRGGRVRLEDSLADLKESICNVTVTLTDPLAALPALSAPAEVLSEQNEGRQRRWMVRILHQRIKPRLNRDRAWFRCVRGQHRSTNYLSLARAALFRKR